MSIYRHMLCIFCNFKKTQVNISRITKKGLMVWRRRECLKCHKLFTTKETFFLDNLFVIKRNGSKQRFMYEKTYSSIFESFIFVKRKDTGDIAKVSKKICEDVTVEIHKRDSHTISTQDLTKVIYKNIQKHNIDASIRYKLYSEQRNKIIEKI